jgi:threonyl-tRNA synthetase
LRQLVSNKVRKQAVAVLYNGRAVDLSAPLNEDGSLEPITLASAAGLEILRHSTAHAMAQAVKELYGEVVKVAIGPAIEDGYYYDFDRETPFSPEDFEAIEKKMAEIARQRIPVERVEMSRDEAIAFFRDRDEPYKVELLEEMEDDRVSLYRQGDFIDLCRGPHIPDTSWLRVFKLLRVAGSYWRGD